MLLIAVIIVKWKEFLIFGKLFNILFLVFRYNIFILLYYHVYMLFWRKNESI